jgi:raffinose/stachyose/melibiose transport system substrate-binding protein
MQAALSLVRETLLEMKPGFIQLTRDDAIQQFMRSEAVFIYTGPWDATTLTATAPFKVQVMHFPQPDAHDPVVGKYVAGKYHDGLVATGLSIYLNRNTRHKEEAIDFLHFLTSMEGGKLYSDNARGISSIRGVKAKPELEIYRPTGEGYHTGVFYMSLGNANTMLSFSQNLNRLFSHEGGVKAFVDAIEADLPTAVVEDLRLDVRASTVNVRSSEAEIAALPSLDRIQGRSPDRADRLQRLASNQTLMEVNKYEAAWAIAHPGR